MKKLTSIPRPDYETKLTEIGLSYHKLDNYWKESSCYEFTQSEAKIIETATNEVHQMCIEAVAYAIKHNRLSQMAIPEKFHQRIKESLAEPSLYGRFDFSYDGVSPPKMLEYNADTPTCLLEGAVAQRNWQKEVLPQHTQFNSLHEKLLERWKFLGYEDITFACIKDNEEDLVFINYIVQTAIEAGINADIVFIEDLNYNIESKHFTTDKKITHLFKLYPYEWLMKEDFNNSLLETSTLLIEPMWKSILSNKSILPLLYEMFPKSDYLLPAYFEPHGMTQYVKKVFFSREGANIEIVGKNSLITPGPYSGKDGHIYQEYKELPCFDGFYPVVGSWVIGDEAAGMNIREDVKVVTTNMSHFVPHYVKIDN